MTPSELAAAIRANPACTDAIAAKDCIAIASTMSEGRLRYQMHFIGFGAVMSALGAVRGAQVLDTLQAIAGSNRVVSWAWALLERGTLDIGDHETQMQLDLLAQGAAITVDDAAKLKALAAVSDPISAVEVANAIFNPDGSIK